MSETLARRVGRLVSGGFHAVLDAAENLAPEAVFHENIRETERAIEEVRGELGRVLAQKHLTSKKIADESNRHETLVEQIQAALAENREDLAAVGVAEQMDIEARLIVLENALADCAQQENELSGFIQALQSTRREMQQQLRDWQVAQQSSHHASPVVSGSRMDKIAANAEKSSQSFERMMLRQGGTALSTSSQAAQLHELEELSRQNRIAERLAAIKAGKT